MHLAVFPFSTRSSEIPNMMCAIQLSDAVIHENLHAQMMCVMEPLQMALNSYWVLSGSNSPKSFWHFKLRWDETISQFRISIWGPEGILFQTITSHHGWNGSPHLVARHCQSPCVFKRWDVPVLSCTKCSAAAKYAGAAFWHLSNPPHWLCWILSTVTSVHWWA